MALTVQQCPEDTTINSVLNPAITLSTIKMKFLVLFGVLATSYALSPEFVNDMKKNCEEISKQCIGDTHVTQEEIDNIKAMKGPSSHEGKCFVACFQKRMGLMNESGKLDKESGMSVIELFKAEDEGLYNKVHELMDKCYGEVSDEADYCETGTKFGGCLKAGAKAAGIDEVLM